MFERYTEKARRVIFFGRYEASQYGSPVIDTEHLLLGLLREDKSLRGWLHKIDGDTLRRRIEEYLPKREPTSTAVDLPLSETAKNVLKRAADEAERLANPHIGTEHLFLGLVEEKHCFAAQLLKEGGADAPEIRMYYAQRAEPPKPWSFQRASYRDLGFRALSGETVEIHGARWNVDYVRDAINLVRTYNWHWHKARWKPRDIVIHRKNGTCSFELALAKDSANFSLAKNGWKKDHCFVCRWELFESDDEHGVGYTNGHDWLCMECYERFWRRPDFFSSSQSEMT
jgi:ClpA/ClpB-like protein